MMKILFDIFQCCCQQFPERSPVYSGVVFPLCFRCAGIFLGIFSSYLYLSCVERFSCRQFDKKNFLLLMLLFLPMMIDGVANAFSIWHTPEGLRAFTGMLTGIPLPFLLNYLFHSQKPGSKLWNKGSNITLVKASLWGLPLLVLLNFPVSIIVFDMLALFCALSFFALLIHLLLSNPWVDLISKNFWLSVALKN